MLAAFRRMADTWGARLFFLILVAAFGLWGIGDVIRNVGSDTAVATVGGRRIEVPEMQDAARRQMAQIQRSLGGKELTPEMRRAAVDQALQRLITQIAIAQEVDRLRLAVPDDALRQTIFAIPAFQGPAGFDRNRFLQVLQSNGLNEGRFVEMMRADLGQRQLMEAARAGVAAPDALVRQVFDLQRETRVADTVELPFDAAPEPPAPTDADLQRYYDNNPESYSEPEFRHVKAVVLSAATIAKDVPVSDDDLRAYYDQHKGEFVTPEKRSVEVIQAQDEAAAKRLADAWRAGADWAAMQKQATDAGANPVELTDTTAQEIPAPELAQAAFSAPPQAVSGPVHGALGWYVLKVTNVAGGANRGFDQVKAEIRDRVAQERAGDLIYDRANKVEDALSSGTKLEDLPGDLGLAAVSGTLDAQGNTQEGTPAPVPGGPELRSQLAAAAFQQKQGDPPHLTEVQLPDGGVAYFAVEVDGITPSERKPFDVVKDQVREDFLRDARRHEQEAAAAKLLAAVKSGQSLDDAATVAGLHVTRTPPIPRDAPPQGVPPKLVQPLFSLKKGEATMVETGEGFVVAQLAEIQEPDPASDSVGYGRVRDQLALSVANDVEVTLAYALRERANPRVNTRLLDTLAEP